MENGVSNGGHSQPAGRRRSRRKSSKAVYEQRRRWKNIGLWVLACLIGGLIVTLIAIYAGGAAT
jgi:hypothetical protein